MPALYTHLLMAEKVIMSTQLKSLLEIIKKHKNVFLLGSQASDPFFFYHMIPVIQSQKESKIVRKLGNLAHNENINQQFEFYLDKAKEDDVLAAYIAGIICHYVADRTIHPYVYYYAGQDSHLHQHIEAVFDSEILKMFKITAEEYQGHKKVKTDRASINKIVSFEKQMFAEIYNKEVSEKVLKDAKKDFILISTLTLNKNGTNFKLAKKLEKLLHIEGYATNIFRPETYDDKTDYMNYRKDIWHNATTNVESNESIEELFAKAVYSAGEMLMLLEQYMLTGKGREEFMSRVDDRGYDSDAKDSERKFFKAR